MALMADEYTREPVRPSVRSGGSGRTGSGGAVPRAAMPPWVREELARQEAAKRAREKAARLRQAADEVDAAPRVVAAPKRLFDILKQQDEVDAAPRVVVGGSPPAANRAFVRGTAEYDARLKEMAYTPISGVASGVGTLSTSGEPKTKLPRQKPFDLNAPRDDVMAAGRELVTEPSRSSGIEARVRGAKGGLQGVVPELGPQGPAQERGRNFKGDAGISRAFRDARQLLGELPGGARWELAAELLQARGSDYDLIDVSADGKGALPAEDERLFRDGLEQELRWSVGSESGYSPPPVARPPEAIPDVTVGNRYTVPPTMLGHEVVADRRLIEIQLDVLRGLPISDSDDAYYRAASPDEQLRTSTLATELHRPEQGGMRLPDGSELWTEKTAVDWPLVYALMTDREPPPSARSAWEALDVLQPFTSGEALLNALSAPFVEPADTGTLRILSTDINTPEKTQLLAEFLSTEFPSERAAAEEAIRLGLMADFEPDENGLGSTVIEGLEDSGFVGDLIANAVDVLLAPGTYVMPGNAALSLAGSLTFEEIVEHGVDPRLAALVVVAGSVGRAGVGQGLGQGLAAGGSASVSMAGALADYLQERPDEWVTVPVKIATPPTTVPPRAVPPRAVPPRAVPPKAEPRPTPGPM